MAGDIAIAEDVNTGTAGSLTADGTIEALGGFIGTLTGTATNLENATADNTVYLGNTAGNAWGKSLIII
ncbi:MAG: hypothetical protein JXM68_07250 [Sedimentisphaerales bacterium]|nr:hypothetical protein [Sedimentisphaerales bacterium]